MQQPIGASELIITTKGTIYHLDLAPEFLADTIITVGDPNRVAGVSKYFDSIEHIAQHREFITHTGFIGKKRISVVGTGIGPDNIDIVLNELDALANIDFNTRLPKENPRSLTVIRMGTCGSLQADVPVDSLVVSSHGIGLDNLLHYYQFTNTEAEQKLLKDFEHHTGLHNEVIAPYVIEGSLELRKQFEAPFVHGITVTCPGFYGPQGRVLRGAIAFPNLIDKLTSFRSDEHRITNFEMETSAIYGLGKILGHRCMSINTIVANRVLKMFSNDAATSIDQMIRTSLEIIEKI
jgi:uridine phosphorylase